MLLIAFFYDALHEFVLALLIITFMCYLCGAWWRIDRVDALRPKGHRFYSRSSHHIGTLGKSFTNSCPWRFGVKSRCNRPEYTPGRSVPGYIMAWANLYLGVYFGLVQFIPSQAIIYPVV